MTKLDKPMRREVQIGDQVYTLTIGPDGLKLVEKGRRKGLELAWTALVSGDAALASALQASVADARCALRVGISRVGGQSGSDQAGVRFAYASTNHFDPTSSKFTCTRACGPLPS